MKRYIYASDDKQFPEYMYHVSRTPLPEHLEVLNVSNPYNVGFHGTMYLDEGQALLKSGFGRYLYVIPLNSLKIDSCDDCMNWASLELVRQFIPQNSDRYLDIRDRLSSLSNDIHKAQMYLCNLFVESLNTNCLTYINLDEPQARHSLMIMDSNCLGIPELLEQV